MKKYDAIVVGSGPNGLAAAITLVQNGRSVLLLEGKETIGGGMRTLELTLPGFKHDICSAIHPLGVGSPFFSQLDLKKHGLEWIFPDVQLAHPFDDGSAAALFVSLEETAETLGSDSKAYMKLMKPIVKDWPKIAHEFLGPLRFPKYPFAMTKFGLNALQSASFLAKRIFKTERGRAYFGGIAAHAIMPLQNPATAAIGLVLGALGHVIGWPLPKGGSQSIANALAAEFQALGGEIETSHEVTSLKALPPSDMVFLDLGPKQLIKLADGQLPSFYRRQLERFRYGPGVFKVDWALSEPIPWQNAHCRGAGTVHVGGSLDEMIHSEREMWNGRYTERPYTLVTQQSLFDNSRAPDNQHTGWAYCHVPSNSTRDMTEIIETQIERFAPGFRDTILAKHVMNTQDFKTYNPNYIGGDINGGVQDLTQLFTRPTPRLNPYSTPLKGVYLCSSSTPPGGGVHGMCGYFAAKFALK